MVNIKTYYSVFIFLNNIVAMFFEMKKKKKKKKPFVYFIMHACSCNFIFIKCNMQDFH